jgi:hypothetical protein
MKKQTIIVFVAISILLTTTGLYSRRNRAKNEAQRIQKWQKALAENPLPKNAVKLKLINHFPRDTDEPEEELVFLRQPGQMCFSPSGSIYVTDFRNHSIYKFHQDGRFQKRIGRRGKGPGDLLTPGYLQCDSQDNIYVLDTNNGRIQRLTEDGGYLHSFRVYEAYSSFLLNLKGMAYLSPLGGMHKPLIQVFDAATGELKGSFGKRMEFSRDLYGLNQVHASMNRKGELYVGWQFFSVVRKYSADRKLVAEYKLDHPQMTKSMQFNYRAIEGPARERSYHIVIARIRAKENGGGFYVFRFYPRIEILEFDDNGELQKLYWAEQPYNYIGNDFLVKEGPDGKRFYVLQMFPEGKVEVFAVQ